MDKRAKIFRTNTNIVEIDLLSQGDPLPLLQNEKKSRYRILVSRAQSHPIADLYAFDLFDRIPSFPLSPTMEDTEIVVELQTLVGNVYERSGYDYFINYEQDVSEAFSDFNFTYRELNWIRQQIEQ